MFNQEDEPSFRQSQVAISGLAPSQSARAQKWLDQLVQVESRMLSNWEEFSAHRNEVQHRLAELTEAMRRKQDFQLQGEWEKCTRRLQQLTQSNEETQCRMSDLKTAVDNGQQSLEGLRSRVSSKLQELHNSFEEQKKDLLSRVSEELQAESSSSKRQNKAVAEELLTKMAELNQKLGENMTSVEEESISRFEGLRGEVQALTKRLDAAPRPEAELRKTEAYFESQLRALRAEMHSQLMSAGQRSDHARLKGLQDGQQELAERIEKVASEAASGNYHSQRAEKQFQELRLAQRADMEEELDRLREEIAMKTGKEAAAQSQAVAELSQRLQRSEELLERCCETCAVVEVLKIAESERPMMLEQLNRCSSDIAEARQGFLAEVDSCRSANRQLENGLRRVEGQLESLSSTATVCNEGLAELKALSREAEKSQLQCREMLEQRSSELQELLEHRAYESSAKMEVFRLADAERQRQLEQLSKTCENLHEARQGLVAEVESCRSIDRQFEDAMRRLDSRVERAGASALQCSEGLADVKAFARELSEKAALQCRDLIEKRNAEMKELVEHHAFEQVSKLEALKLADSEARRGLVTEVENCRSIQRQLEDTLQRVDTRLESVSSVATQCSGGMVDVKAFAQSAADKARGDALQQSREIMEQKGSQIKELVDRKMGDMGSKVEALKVSSSEQQQQVEQLLEQRKGLQIEMEQCRSGYRHLEDALRGHEVRLERQQTQLGQAMEGLVESKLLSRELVEKMEQRCHQMELRSVELKDLLEQRVAEGSAKVEALRLSDAERQKQLQQLAESSRGSAADIESCRSIDRKLEEDLRRVASQSAEGTAEVKSFAREAAEKAFEKCKELVDSKMEEVGSKLEALKVSGSEHQQQLEQLTEQRKGLQAEAEQGKTKHRHLEDALRGQEVRLERQQTQLAQLVEGLAESKALTLDAAEKIGQRCRELTEVRSIELKDLVEKRAADTSAKVEALRLSDGDQQQQLQQLQKTCAELAEVTRGCVAERKFEEDLRRLAEGTSEVKVFAQEAADKALQKCKELVEKRSGEWKESLSQLRVETSNVEKDLGAQREELQQLKKQNQKSESNQELQKAQLSELTAELQATKAAELEKSSQLALASRNLAAELAETKKGIYADLDACQAFERSLEASQKTCNEKLSALESQCHEGLVESKSFTELVDKALKTSMAEVLQQLEEMKRGLGAEVQMCQTNERQLEMRLERVYAAAAQCSEGLNEVKTFARETMARAMAELKEQLERKADAAKLEALQSSSLEQQQQLEQLPERIQEARRGLMVELEKAQTLHRQLDEVQRLCETRLEKVSSLVVETSSGVQEAKALAQSGRELTEHRVAELKELLEHQASQTASLREAVDAVQRSTSEQQSQLQSVSKTGEELGEARRGMTLELEKCQSLNRKLEEDVKYALGKIEKVFFVANQTSEGLADMKSFTREAVENAQLQSKQLIESRLLEMKEHFDHRNADASSKIEALKASELDQAISFEGLVSELDKCQAAERHLEEVLRRVDSKVDRVAEGVTEVKAFTRQAVEDVAVQSRELLEQRAGEIKAHSDEANQELRALRLYVQDEVQRQVQASRAEATERDHRLSSRLQTQAQEAQDLRLVLDEQLKRQENISSELREAQEVFHSKVSKVSTDFAESKDGLKKYMTDALRKNEQKLQVLTAQPRLLGLVMDELEGVVRGVAQRELQIFQREALDSMEWKLERCVQWLHGANVKLGLNPHGTLFSPDRFREVLFEEAEPVVRDDHPGPKPQSARTRARSTSRGRS